MNTRKRFVRLLEMHKMEKVAQSPACEILLSREMMVVTKEQALANDQRQLPGEATTTMLALRLATITGQLSQQRRQEAISQAAPGELVGPGSFPLQSYPQWLHGALHDLQPLRWSWGL